MDTFNDGLIYSPATRIAFAVQQIHTGYVNDRNLAQYDVLADLEKRLYNRDIISSSGFWKSTKTIQHGERMHPDVPLTASWENKDVSVKSFRLVDTNLDVEVQNYNHLTSMASVPPSQCGVYAAIIVRGCDRKVAFERVSGLVTTLREFYGGKKGL